MSKRWPKWMPPVPEYTAMGWTHAKEFETPPAHNPRGTHEVAARLELLAWYEAAKKAEGEYWRKVHERDDAKPRWEIVA